MIRVFSYGGGLDSFALLLMALWRGEIPDFLVFVDVGNGTRWRDSTVPAEWPGTYQHIREVVIPLCERFGIPFIWIDSESYPVRNAASLFEWMDKRLQIPVSGPDRICTIVAKVERFERWMNDTFPGQTVEVWIGFEAGEETRAEKDPNAGRRRKVGKNGKVRERIPKPTDARRVNRFPLIEWGLCRCRCAELARASGFPVPRKSACTTCCYNTMTDWQTLARELPEDFAAAARLELQKPETENGFKLSIGSFSVKRDKVTREVLSYRAPPLPVYIQGTPKPRAVPCLVCGAAQRATKAVACGYLEPARAA